MGRQTPPDPNKSTTPSFDSKVALVAVDLGPCRDHSWRCHEANDEDEWKGRYVRGSWPYY